MPEHPLVLSELVARLRWFVSLRWVAALGIAASAAVLWLAGSLTDPAPLFIIAGVVAAINAAYHLRLRRAEAATISAGQAVQSAEIQIAVDLLLLTFVLHESGGAENPFFMFYFFHVIIASILLPARASYLQATLAVFLFTGLALLELLGVVPHVGIAALGTSASYRHTGYVLAVILAFGSTVYLAAFMATNIVSRLRQREDEVIALKDSLQAEQVGLSNAYRQLQDVTAAKARHMRKVGHELRAPLAAVQTLQSTALSGAAGSIDPEVRGLLERAVERTRAMIKMVDDLLALSRAREVTALTPSRQVRVDEVAQKVIALFAPSAQAKGVALHASIEPELPAIEGDPVGIEELLINLVSNAVKYTPSGGNVRVSARTADSKLAIEVSDTGIGIAAEELPHIFDEFYRSERARQAEREGTGLGLAIVHAVAEAHHGEIAVDSQPGEGVTMTVVLPLTWPKTAARKI